MRKKILVVDDDTRLNRMIQLALKDSYATLSTHKGEEGVGLALMEAPNLILMDLMMYDMNGLEAIRLIRRNSKTSSIPIIVMTGGLSNSIKDECSKIGSVDYIAKPFTCEELLRRIEKLLENGNKQDTS